MPRVARLLPALALVAAALPGAAAAQDPDPALEQRIDAHQALAGGRAVLARGHVDIGPRYVGGRWTLMIHDDTARADGGRSVWRRPEATVLRVADAARHPAPDDPDYAFLHAAPGTPVHVVPQTQEPDVVWVGWNTQDPRVMETIDRGAKLTLTGLQGPGTVVVYLQSGSFDAPKVLWDSTAAAQPVWLDVNTHTHANWVFSKPGVYLVRLEVTATLVDGTTVTDARDVRFAVGDRADASRAFAATWRGPAPAGTARAATPRTTTPDDDGGGSGGGTVVAIVLVAVALAGALAWTLVRGGRAKRRARGDGPGAG
jgi:surface-anchored protein